MTFLHDSNERGTKKVKQYSTGPISFHELSESTHTHTHTHTHIYIYISRGHLDILDTELYANSFSLRVYAFMNIL